MEIFKKNIYIKLVQSTLPCRAVPALNSKTLDKTNTYVPLTAWHSWIVRSAA